MITWNRIGAAALTAVLICAPFTAVVSVLTAVICGLAPAFEGSRTDIQDTMRDSPRQAGGVRPGVADVLQPHGREDRRQHVDARDERAGRRRSHGIGGDLRRSHERR